MKLLVITIIVLVALNTLVALYVLAGMRKIAKPANYLENSEDE